MPGMNMAPLAMMPLHRDCAESALCLRDAEFTLDNLQRERAELVGHIFAYGSAATVHGEALHAAIILTEHAEIELARRLFQRLITTWPDEEEVVYEHVQFLRRLGDHSAADDAVATILRDGTGGASIVRELLIAGHLDFGRPDGFGHLDSLLDDALTQHRSAYFHAVAHHLRTSGEEWRRMFARFTSVSQADPYSVYRRCRTAITRRTPFCLLRLGDGEGAFLHPQPPAKPQMPMHAEHERFFALRWYGDASIGEDPRFRAIAAEIADGLPAVDVLGMPLKSWVLHEARLRNIGTLLNCLQVMHLVEQSGVTRKALLTDTSISIDLAFHGYMEKLVRLAGRVSLITSHAALGGELAEACGVRITRSMMIPPAASDRERIGNDDIRSHFREVFPAVLDWIDGMDPGEVCLVSAGFLGKFYALRIKARGGIALDIGSLADLWLGHLTRPGFVQLDKLRLTARRTSAGRRRALQTDAALPEAEDDG